MVLDSMSAMAEETTSVLGSKRSKKKAKAQKLKKKQPPQPKPTDGLSSFSKARKAAAKPVVQKQQMKRKAAGDGAVDAFMNSLEDEEQKQTQTKRAKGDAAAALKASLLRKGAAGLVKPAMPGPSMAELASAAPTIEDTDEESDDEDSDDASTGDDASPEQPAAAEDTKPLRKSPRLAAALAAPPSDDFGLDDESSDDSSSDDEDAASQEDMDFDLDETVTGGKYKSDLRVGCDVSIFSDRACGCSGGARRDAGHR